MFTALSSQCDDDWWWDLRVQIPWQAQETPWVCQTGSPSAPFSPWPSQSCSGALWAKLSSQAAWKGSCQQLLLAFFVSNLAKDPSGPTPRYCWKAEHRRVQLCEEASGCECSAPNQHVGVTTLHVLWSCNGPVPTTLARGTHPALPAGLTGFCQRFASSPAAPLRWAGIVISFSHFLPISGPSFVHPKIGPWWHLHVYMALTFPNWLGAML